MALKHEEVTELVLKVFYEVYNELGYGFLENVYERAMLMALRQSGLQVESQVAIPVFFRDEKIADYVADLLVNGRVILELKAVKAIDRAHEAQLLHYLRATEIEVGLLLNFGQRPEFRRLLFDNERKRHREKP